MQGHILYISSESCQFSLKLLQLGVEQEHSIHIWANYHGVNTHTV